MPFRQMNQGLNPPSNHWPYISGFRLVVSRIVPISHKLAVSFFLLLHVPKHLWISTVLCDIAAISSHFPIQNRDEFCLEESPIWNPKAPTVTSEFNIWSEEPWKVRCSIRIDAHHLSAEVSSPAWNLYSLHPYWILLDLWEFQKSHFKNSTPKRCPNI